MDNSSIVLLKIVDFVKKNSSNKLKRGRMRIFFRDREEAGQLLAQALLPYKEEDLVILGLPRGGVVLAAEVARLLKAPLDCIFARKIGHPLQAEYAIAAISESGEMVGNSKELDNIDPKWLE